MERALATDAQIARIAAEQHGVIALHQLLAIGLSRGAVSHRLHTGRLHRLHRGAYAVGHARITREGRWLAAVLACGEGAVLSHVSAGALWGLRRSSAVRTHVTVPTGAGRRRREGIVTHRSTTLDPADTNTQHAIAVTSVARTLFDLAGMLAPGPLERAVEQSLILRLFDVLAVTALVEADPTRRGAGTLRRIIETIHHEPALTRSELEALMRDLCDAHALPRPEVNVVVEGREVDFLWRAHRLIVETDGYATHGTRSAFENDRARDARLTLLGFRVVRFTHRQLACDRNRVAATLLALLA